MSNFAEVLQSKLESNTGLNRRERVLDILRKKGNRRDRQVARMERHVRAQLDLGNKSVDWDSIDWPSVLEKVLKMLLALLPFIL